MINFHLAFKEVILISVILFSSIGLYLILRIDWKRYGLLFLLSAILGNVICYIFIRLGFYTIKYDLVPDLISIIATAFGFLVMLATRFRPTNHTFSYFLMITNVGTVVETVIRLRTGIITYDFAWDMWDSYTWWWIFFRFFDYVATKIIPDDLRHPLNTRSRWYWATFVIIFAGTVTYAIVHFVRVSQG